MDTYTVALVGSPNVGKTTLFNRLTGQHRHTGNWCGATVTDARGRYIYKGRTYCLVDLPGTYTVRDRTGEGAVTGAYLEGTSPDCILVLADAASLTRSLTLAQGLAEQSDRLVLGVNLMDEAQRRGLQVDLPRLEGAMGLPTVGLSAARDQGIDALQETVRQVCQGYRRSRSPTGDPAAIAAGVVTGTRRDPVWEVRLDRWLLRPWTGALAFGLLLWGLLWLTIQGAGYPSAWLQGRLEGISGLLTGVLGGLPGPVQGLILEGVYGTTAQVVAVMMPPMAIFFPLFALLEEVGLLPRLALLLDRPLARWGSEGRMALTMCMGLGCNAAGVTGCRIIPPGPEREIARITNGLIPCNGRIPALILLAGVLARGRPAVQTAILALALVSGVLVTGLLSRLLRRTVYRRDPGAFVLELPPYRRPRLLRVLWESLRHRTLVVLRRAVAIAAPAGAVLWLLGQITLSGRSLLTVLSAALDPAAAWLGMTGALLLAFILALPAGELVLPVAALISGGALVWPTPMAWCTLVFFLFHWPCATTIATVWRESGSVRTTALAVALPTAVGVLGCLILRWILV